MGKTIWTKVTEDLPPEYFNISTITIRSCRMEVRGVVPYRIWRPLLSVGTSFKQSADENDKVDSYAELYLNGIALGASVYDYLKVDIRDYNMGSGYSFKFSAGLLIQKQWSFC